MNFFKTLLVAIFLPLAAQAQIYQPVTAWRYAPVNVDFWQKIQEYRLKKDPRQIINIAEEKLTTVKSDLELAEIEYAKALACQDLDYYFCAYDLSISILTKNPGSMPALGSLFILENLVQKEVIIEDELQRLINIGNFVEVPEELMPMLSFYVYKDNLKKNLKEWLKESSNGLANESYWKNRLAFFKALLLVQKGEMASAVKALNQLEKNVQDFPKFKEAVRLQQARVLYEMRDFKQAENIYASFSSERRDLGKILLERAWVKYFQKDYSFSLGMIEALKSPYFRPATHPEQYILAMVTYRDLCHYKAVGAVYKEFENVFKPWVEHLKGQKPLFENKALLSMVLLQAKNLRLGNMIGQIRLERVRARKEIWPAKFKQKLEATYNLGEFRWKDFAKQALAADLKSASEELLEYVEQAKLLEYISSLDKFRMKARFENREYKALEVDNYAIKKLFWPVGGEYWWNEINSYQVLVSDRCNEGG